MILKKTYYKAAVCIAILFASETHAQLVGSDVQIWEKANTTIRQSSDLSEQDLLNFHDGIKNRFLKKYIKHSRNKSHTISLVHTSKEDEKIWENEAKKISLSNNIYEKGQKYNVKINKRPSIFSYTGTAEKNLASPDSIKIRFEDKNLFEMIFIPRKAKSLDLNKIHSYLSIKYGISLEKGKYISSDGKLIWDPAKHKEFTHRPTGLGRDDGNELYQKQSCNQQDKFLTMGRDHIFRTNVENQSLFDQNNFVIWSDDDKKMDLQEKENLRILERNWEINFIGLTVPKTGYQVRIDKTQINPDSLPLAYWMLLKDSAGEITKIAGAETNDFVVFDKVDFVKQRSSISFKYFTFATGPIPKTRDGENMPSVNNPHDEVIALNLEKIKLYPNPVKKGQEFTIVFPAMENLSISIYDGGGRLVRMNKVDRNSKSYQGYLNIQSSYLITLVNNGNIIKTFKLIVD